MADKDFRAIIKAQLDTSDIPNQIRTHIENQTITFNNISFNRNSLISQIQSVLDNYQFRINLGANNLFNNDFLQQMRQSGSNAGQQFASSFNRAINGIDLHNGGIGHVNGMLQQLGFDRNSLRTITENLGNMKLQIDSIKTTMLSSGNIRLTITGQDELLRSVQIVRDFDKETGNIINTSKSFLQNFAQIEQQTKKNEAAISKYLSKLDTLRIKSTDQNTTKPIENEAHLEALASEFDRVRSIIEGLNGASSQTFVAMKANVESEINSLGNLITSLQNAEYAASQLRAKPVETVKAEQLELLRVFIADIQKAGISLDQFTKVDINSLRSMLQGVFDADGLKQYLNTLSVAKAEFKGLKQEAAQYASASEVNILKGKMEVWLNKNTRASREYGNTIRELINELDRLSASGGVLRTELKKIFNNFKEVDIAANAAGLKGRTFLDTMKGTVTSLSRYFSSMTLITKAIEGLGAMFDNVLKVDTAMTELYRVTDLTEKQYDQLFDKMVAGAKKYNASLTDVINTTAEWVRYGFNANVAEQLAELTVMYQHVTDLDHKVATENLLTAYKGFQPSLDARFSGDSVAAVERIMDIYDKLGNELPVSAAQVAEGVNKSASVLQEAGATLEQASALIVGGGSVTQDFSAMGNAIKISTLRIHGMKGKLEELGEEVDENISSVSKIQTQILNLTHGKVNIFEDDGEHFRNIYDVYKDIASIWDSLSDTEAAELLELIAGKNRSNSIQALVTNWSDVEKSIRAANNASGTAREEQERYSQSLKGRIDSLNASLQATSNTILSSDLLKDGTSLLNGAVNSLDFIINKLGTIPTLIMAITTVSSIKNFGRDKRFSLQWICRK